MQVGKNDILLSYLAQGLRWGQSLIVLPFVLRVIPSDDLAFWYLFITINSMVMLFDFGFSQTIVRNVTYVFSGARTLLKEGIANNDIEDKSVDPVLLSHVIITSIHIYRTLSYAIFVIMAILGTYYISSVIDDKGLVNTAYIWSSWGVMIVSIVTSFYFLYLTSLLMGRGYIRQAQKATIISTTVSMVLTLAGLYVGLGILAMALSSLISTVVNRFLCRRYFWESELKAKLKNVPLITSQQRKEMFGVLWYNAKKLGFVLASGFMITRIGQFFVTSFFALSIAAQYGLTMQIVSVVGGLATTYLGAITPKLTHDFYQKNYIAVKKHFGLVVTISFLTYLTCCLGLIFVGEPLLVLIKSKTQLLPSFQIAFLFLIFFLETQHSIFSGIHSMNNTIPFIKPAILSGVAIVVLSYFALSVFTPNLWYLMTVQFVIQLAYNNWKWIYDACKFLKTSLFEFYRIGFIELYNKLSKLVIKNR